MFFRRREARRQIARGPEGTRLYAVGDIHGCADLLATLREAILADRAGFDGAARTIFLGDYIDRGPDTRRVIDILLDGSMPDPVFLRGNHEEMLLHFLADPASGDLWRRNGAIETLTSYGIDIRQMQLGRDLAAAAAALDAELPARHRAFFAALEPWHREGDYFFCHAGVRPGLPLDAQAPADLTWIREDFLASTADHGAVVVHGHTPAPAPEVLPNRINIDTGAFLSNRLTCLVVEGEERRFIQATPFGVEGQTVPAQPG